MTNIIFPDGVTTIRDRMFWGCTRLTAFTISGSVTNIGSYAFDSCSSLISVAIPSSVTRIGSYAFAWCTTLTNITIPGTVTTIGAYAFSGCRSLANITIPDNVTTIGSYAFYWCPALTIVYFTGDAPEPGASVFESTPATIYYLPNTIGWDDVYADRPAFLWNPTFTSFDINAGTITYTVIGTPEIPIAIESSTNLLSGEWTRLSTTNLSAGSLNIQSPDSANYAARFYRIVGP